MGRRKAGTGLSANADEARQQILAAAERVIQRYGVPKTTMDDIAKETGVLPAHGVPVFRGSRRAASRIDRTTFADALRTRPHVHPEPRHIR